MHENVIWIIENLGSKKFVVQLATRLRFCSLLLITKCVVELYKYLSEKLIIKCIYAISVIIIMKKVHKNCD